MKKIVSGALILLAACCAMAQNFTPLPYSFGFEDSEAAELQNWHLNPGCNMDSADLWTVGSFMHNQGSKAMYLSVDSGVTSTVGFESENGNPKELQFAYRDFVFPGTDANPGSYYISFDWVCPNMVLYVGYVNYVPNSVTGQPSTAANAVSFVSGSAASQLPTQLGTPLFRSSKEMTWQNKTLKIQGIKQPNDGQVRYTRLWFAWMNSLPDSTQKGISAAIDNIYITKAGCELPQFFVGEVEDCDHLTFTWQGSSAKYELQYRALGEENWRTRRVNNGALTYTLNGMKEGNYDFRIRGVCYETDGEGNVTDTLYSPYAYLSNFNVFCPELHCINYVNIHDTAIASCTYGTSGSDYGSSLTAPYQNKGCIDFGWDDVNSRHTVVWDTLATDPRTNNMLRMVPQGSNASVRLGNWEWGNGTEAITYTYTVDPGNSILLVRYAIVLEAPSGHGEDGVPRFIVKVRDESGNLVDATCGVVDLNSETTQGTGWTSISGTGGTVVFKDWTMMGLNLDPYVGRTLQISVETFDCFWGGHYGYAYFTMECAAARIKNTACGQQATMKVVAPVGFNYSWSAGGQVRSTEREVEILPSDPTDWTCTLTSTENEGCSFDLTVNTTARYPQAEFSLEYEPSECQNLYKVTNTSYIWTNEKGGRIEHRDEVCDDYEWDFGIGDEGIMYDANPGYVMFPEEGGQFTLHLKAMIGSGKCESDTFVVLDVPKIGDTNAFDTIQICQGKYCTWHNKRYFEEGDYIFQQKTEAGCYANDRLHLIVNPTYEVRLAADTICFGDSLHLVDTVYVGSKAGDRALIRHLATVNCGCDSALLYTIHTEEQILPKDSVQGVDEDHPTGSIYLSGTGYTYYTINGEEGTAPVIDGLMPNVYELVFYNDFGCSVARTINLSGCLASAVYQRWNDVLSIKREDLIPQLRGTSFARFQWRKNGVDIPGAVDSYYYAPDGLELAEYTCFFELNDGTENETCPFVPVLTSKQNVGTRKELNNGRIRIVRGDDVYDIYGNHVVSF